MVGDHIVALLYLAYLTDLWIYSRNAPWIGSTEHILVNDAVVDKSVVKTVWQK